MNLFAIAASATLLFSSGLSHAQLGAPAPLPQVKKVEGPTLEQTTAWISNKFSSTSFVRNRERNGVEVKSESIQRLRAVFDGCKMTVGMGSPGEIYSWQGLLGDLDAENFKLNPVGFQDTTQVVDLHIETIGKMYSLKSPSFSIRANITAPDFVATITNAIAENPSSSYSFFLRILDVDTAQSVGNAFKHAAMLCRQQIADEKAAKPARPKDLF